jgi:hypothetical protein
MQRRTGQKWWMLRHSVSKKLSPVLVDRMWELYTRLHLGPSVISARMGIPARTVFAYLAKLKSEKGGCITL